MQRQAQREAFARACTYLNYRKGAVWLAHACAAGAGIVTFALLVVLWVFTDLLVFRGRLPSFTTLPVNQQQAFLAAWGAKEVPARQELLRQVGFSEAKAAELAVLEPSRALDRTALGDGLWRAQLGGILLRRVGEDGLERVRIGADDRPRSGLAYDEIDHGLLSLVVRSDVRGSLAAPLIASAARWSRWTWNRGDGQTLFSSFLLGLLLIALGLVLVGFLLVLLMREMAARAAIEASTRLRRAVYHHTTRLGTLAFRAFGPTEAVTVFTRHVEAVHDSLHARLTAYFREPITIGLLLLFALIVQVWLALAFLLFALLIWFLGGQAVAYFRKRSRLASNQAGERLTVLRESLMMMRLVKCYLMEQFNQSRVERQLAQHAHAQMIRYRGEAVTMPLLIFLGTVATLLLLFVAGLVVLAGQMSLAGIVVLVTSLVAVYLPLERWLEAVRLTRRGRLSAVEIFTFLEQRPDVGQVVGADFLNPLSKQIEFDNVSLREPGGTRMLLENVTLTIPAGQRIGLIGANNLEKHALVYLIPRLIDPTSGEIRVDSHNLRWVTLDSLRNQMAVVLQHNLVFHDTVANNIGCGDPGYTLPQIIEAAKVAHAHHFIQKLPQGYETPIGELGHSLTTSQKFRIALARAILRDPALLMIEEPETELDEDTKSLLDDTMTRILPGRTTIFLPHRISTIRSCARLYLLHHGKVVATGDHRELLSENALYRHLHYLEFNEMD